MISWDGNCIEFVLVVGVLVFFIFRGSDIKGFNSSFGVIFEFRFSGYGVGYVIYV